MNILKKTALAAALTATGLTAANPAMAQDHYRDRGGDNTAAVAIGAGIIGLAIGAIVASSDNDRDDRRYRDRRYRHDQYGYQNYRYNQGHYRNQRDDRRGAYRTDARSRDDYQRRGYRDGYYSRGR